MEIDSLFGDPQATQAYAAQLAPADHRPRQAAYVVTIMVLGLAAVGLSMALLETRQSQEAWQASAEQRASQLDALESQRDDLRRQLGDAQVALASAEESLASATAQLEEATGQVKALTEQKAGMLDKATFLPAALAMATELAQSVSSCALVLEGGAPAAPVVAQPGADPAAIVAPAVEGEPPCDRARADSEAFTKWLGSQ